MATYQNDDKNKVKLFDFGVNITRDQKEQLKTFFWWARIKNKKKVFTIFEVEKGFVFRESTTFERVNFDYKNNEKIGKAKTKEDLKAIFLKSKYHLRYKIDKSKTASFSKEEQEEDDMSITQLIEVSGIG